MRKNKFKTTLVLTYVLTSYIVFPHRTRPLIFIAFITWKGRIKINFAILYFSDYSLQVNAQDEFFSTNCISRYWLLIQNPIRCSSVAALMLQLRNTHIWPYHCVALSVIHWHDTCTYYAWYNGWGKILSKSNADSSIKNNSLKYSLIEFIQPWRYYL